MATTKKALALADELISELKQRGFTTVSLSYDTDQNPLVRVGTGVAGATGALIKFSPIDWPNAKDILGLPAEVYNPHVARIAFEAPTAGAGADVDPNTFATKYQLLAVLFARGLKTELYESAAGVAPVGGTFVSGNLKSTFEYSAQYGILQGQ